MKKFLYTLLAVATLGLAAGCQREQSVKEEGPMVDVSFNVNIQGLQTKAFSDGTQAKDLYVAVYANRTEGAVFMEGISTDQIGAFADGLTATVKLRLVRGENYDIVFWAQAPGAPYTLDKAAKTLTVSTEGKANDELRDAFYGVWTGTPVTAPQDVTLQRPFAQINVLTTADDWAALQNSGIPFAGSSMTFTAPTVLELTTGKATTPKEYNLAFDAIDPDAVNIPGYEQTHKYIAMNYVLAGERLTEKLNFTIYRAADDPLGDFEVVNVPYQRNYRTNVWGEIFTVEGEFHVTIDPVYEDDIDWPMEGEEQTLALVPGSTLAAAAQMDDNNVWHVSVKKDATMDFTGVETDATGATVEYKSSNEEVGGFITNKAGEFTALKAGETTVTVNFTADGYKPAAMTFVVTVTEDAPVTGDTAAPATFALDSNLGLDNGTEMTELTSGDVTLTPGKGTNNNAPKYYTSGDAVRFYGSNTLTVSGGDKLIKSVKFTYSQAPTDANPLSADSGDMTADWVTWTGSAKSVTFTVGGTSGQVRISKVEVNTESTTTTLYWIDPITPDNGTLEIDANEPWEFAEGTPIKVIATPATNYELSELYYTDENDGHKTDIDKQTLTFDMPGFNVLVYATFTEKTVQPTLYTVEFGDMEHGSVSLATPANGFAAGETVTLSVVPDDNYELDEETLTYNTEGVDDRNPITKDATGAYSFTMPASNVTVYARFKEKTVTPAANDGSQAHPFTVAEVRGFIDGLKGAVSENEVYVAGKIASIANNGQFSASFGNASFFISDDGQASSDQFEAYRVLYLGRKKWVEGDATIKVGDDVVICGKVKLYSPSNGDPVYETHQSNADNYNGYLYSLNGQTEIVNNTPVITADNISGIPAAGVQNAAATVTIANLGNGSVTATPDGTVVTTASWVNDVLIYTVAANTGDARSGKVTISVIKDNKEYSKEITIGQLAGNVDPSAGTTYNFGAHEGFTGWDTGYKERTLTYTEADVVFASANKQASTITDMPVTKGGDVSMVMKGTNKLAKVTFTCKQWTTKPQTIELHYSTDGGTTYTTTSITSTNFSISDDALPTGTNAVKITFSSKDNQVGIESVTFKLAE